MKHFIHSFGALLLAFSTSLSSQTDHSLTSALECKTLSLPQFRPWESFNTGDLPISDANSWNATEIVSKKTSQGDDGNTVDVRYKNPVSVYGGSVSTAFITTDIFGAQQTALIEVSNFDLFKESIEKQLSFKFSLNQDKYNYFNPTNGMEYQISKATESQSSYYFSCGLNKERYQDALANPDKYKSPQELEKDKAAQEEQQKKSDAFLLQNNKVFKQFIEQTEWATIYGPVIGLVIGILALIAGNGLLYLHFKNKSGNKNTKFISGTSANAIGLVLTGLSVFQYVHPVFKVDSKSVEIAWLQTAEHVRNDDRYIKTFLNTGKILTNEGSVAAAKELAFIYAGGSDVVEKNVKAAQYYANLFESTGKQTDVNIESIKIADATAAPAKQSMSPSNQRWQTYKPGGIIYFDTTSLSHDAQTDNGRVNGYVIIDRVTTFRAIDIVRRVPYYLPGEGASGNFEIFVDFYCAKNAIFASLDVDLDFRKNIIFTRSHTNDIPILNGIVSSHLNTILESLVKKDVEEINSFLCPKIGQVVKQKNFWQKLF